MSGQLFDERRTLAGEQTAADFEAADGAAERVRECAGVGHGIHVERD
jgi:hypothetical protein